MFHWNLPSWRPPECNVLMEFTFWERLWIHFFQCNTTVCLQSFNRIYWENPWIQCFCGIYWLGESPNAIFVLNLPSRRGSEYRTYCLGVALNTMFLWNLFSGLGPERNYSMELTVSARPFRLPSAGVRACVAVDLTLSRNVLRSPKAVPDKRPTKSPSVSFSPLRRSPIRPRRLCLEKSWKHKALSRLSAAL